MNTANLVKEFSAFFAVMNPFMVLPFFLAATSGFNGQEQRALALKVAVNLLFICGAVVFAGQGILSFFGVSIDVFRMVGGVLLCQIAWSMVNGQAVAAHEGSAAERQSTKEIGAWAFYPLAFPMIVGPGTIATIIIYSAQAKSVEDTLATASMLAIIIFGTLAVMLAAPALGRRMSETMRTIMTRLMGLILLAIAFEMVIAGIKSVFPSLA